MPAMLIAPQVEEALRSKKAVVALETAIVTHGLPHPLNIEVAHRCNQIVEQAGATPACIGVLEGTIIVGMNLDQITQLAQHPTRIKIGRRDLSIATATGASGGTTVSATISVASLCGIRIFVTGGIGGVHYGAEKSLDISADLPQIASCEVAVVSAGPKAILNAPLTCEYLETHSVPIIGYKCTTVPLFYSRESNLPVTATMHTTEEIARYLHQKWSMALRGGVLVVNPCPEKEAIPVQDIQQSIETALAEARASNIVAQEVTPFLLSRLTKLTHNKTLKANQALAYNNAQVGAQLAIAYSQNVQKSM